MKKSNLLYCFLLINLMSCREKNNTAIRIVNVCYAKGFIEKSHPIECGLIKYMPYYLKQDTMILDAKILYEIEQQVDKLVKDSNSIDCDIRIECEVIFKNNKTIKLCIGGFNCILLNNIKMKTNDYLVYLIRQYSGYYNYFSKENLIYFDELKKNGIPANYKDYSKIGKFPYRIEE